ncbi:LOW QUALITY PROTEIN: hypothetical protein TorRG33x02_045910 [Trema orientale]|uniref:Uncharacterized protein n=1 Tax=Trema orientale TaxID=63057 RepID=A0A2P5FNQ8_TREOI|nr:LOW QUALITY PROTEIN: hypothetical protein TorRG33x02_045910 [Trema orientale]
MLQILRIDLKKLTFQKKKKNISRKDLKDFLFTHQKIGNDENTVNLAKVFMVDNILTSKRDLILMVSFSKIS